MKVVPRWFQGGSGANLGKGSVSLKNPKSPRPPGPGLGPDLVPTKYRDSPGKLLTFSPKILDLGPREATHLQSKI